MIIRTTFLFCFLLVDLAFAQNIPPAIPPAPPSLRSPVQPSAGAGDSSDSSVLQNAPIATILDEYEALSGKHLVRDASLNGLPALTINGNGMSKDEFLKFIQYNLQLNGITLVPIDAKTIKVLGTGSTRLAKNEGIPIYTSENEIPIDDSVISFCVQLTNITPQDAKTVFDGYAAPHAYGSYVPVANSREMIITENANTVKKLLQIIRLIDVPPAPVATEFIPLTRANAVDVADSLNKLIEDRQAAGSTPTASAPPPGTPSGTAPTTGNSAPAGPNERSLIVGTARISADERSNQVLIITRPENMAFLRRLVSELDCPSTASQPHRRPLNFVNASNILPAIQDELSSATKEGSSHPTTQVPSTPSRPVQTSNTGSGSSDSGNGVAASPLTPPDQNDTPTVISVGQTKILADDRSNSIIVFGTPDNVDRVFAVIDQLDRRPLQVYLSVVIGQLSISGNSEFGLDLLQKYLKSDSAGVASSSILSPNTTSSGSVPEPTSITSSSLFPILSPGTLGGLTVFGAIGSELNAYVHALQSTGQFRIIARPSVYTTNNKLASISSGQQVPVPVNSLSGFAGGSSNLASSTNIGYKNVLLSLQVIPRVSFNHQVNLQIQQENDTLGSSVAIAGNSVPTVNTQLINTEVTVNSGNTVVIGGLISDSQTTTSSGVPLLQDIPLLGHLFRDDAKVKKRDELVILIRPVVIDTDVQSDVNSAYEIQRLKIGPPSSQSLDGIPIAPIAAPTTTKPLPTQP